MIIKNTNVINGKLCNNNKYHNTKVIYNEIKFDSIYKNIVMQKN